MNVLFKFYEMVFQVFQYRFLRMVVEVNKFFKIFHNTKLCNGRI